MRKEKRKVKEKARLEKEQRKGEKVIAGDCDHRRLWY